MIPYGRLSDHVESAGTRRLRAIGYPVLLSLVGALVYSNSLDAPFIHDDLPTILDPAIHQLWPPARPLWASHESVAGGRPLASLALALNWAIGGMDVRGYHAVNVALHVSCALLLYGVIRRTLRGRALAARYGRHADHLALAAALLWMLHPVQTQVASYVAHRTESIMGIFYLGTLYCAIRSLDGRAGWWTAAAIASCALGMASKEVMATAPLMVVLYDLAYREGTWRALVRRRIGLYAGLAATWLLLAAFMAAGRRASVTGFGVDVTVQQYAMNQCLVIAHYLKLVFVPHPLIIDYGWPRAVTVYEIGPAAALLAALLAAAAIAFLWRPALGYPAVWFFVILAPTSSVVPILTEVGADRRMYLSLAGPVVLFVVGGYRLLGALAVGWVGAALVAVAAVALSWLTVRQNHAYRDPLVIWQTCVEAVPENPGALNNLGNQLRSRGRIDEAVGSYRRALNVNPDYALAHVNLGNVLRDQGRPSEALGHHTRAVELLPPGAPATYQAHYNLGVTYLALGRTEDAVSEFRLVLEDRPDLADVRTRLGLALGRLGRLDEAIEQFRAVLEAQPLDAETHFHLAIALRMTGRTDGAIEHFRAAVQIMPGHGRAHANLAAMLQAKGDLPEAIHHYRLALAAEPSAAVHANLAAALHAQGELGEAESHARQAIALDPASAEAHRLLGRSLAAAGRPGEAVTELREAARLAPQDPAALNDLAWVLATGPEPRPEEAVDIAERAASMTAENDPEVLDTLAAAYASAGRFPEAAATARRAITLAEGAGNADLAARLRGSLELYERREIFSPPGTQRR